MHTDLNLSLRPCIRQSTGGTLIEYNEKEQRMVLKLVYYGPALSGKTSNLLRLNDLLTGEGRSDLMVLDTSEDRTIFFDLLPFSWSRPAASRSSSRYIPCPAR